MMDNFLTAFWENLIMVNYAVEPKVLNPYLPNGVELDLFEGKAWLSLVGFLFKNVKIFGVPVPFYGTFEEINIRFYVVRKFNNEARRGVVFINETVPSKLVSRLANYLYNEHYTAIPTNHKWNITDVEKQIAYQWKTKNKWNSLSVRALNKSNDIAPGSKEEFIFEHYYGYAKINDKRTEEYKVEHPRWVTHEISDFAIDCNFSEFYGAAFDFMNIQAPASVMLAEGSAISVKWKRNKI